MQFTAIYFQRVQKGILSIFIRSGRERVHVLQAKVSVIDGSESKMEDTALVMLFFNLCMDLDVLGSSFYSSTQKP